MTCQKIVMLATKYSYTVFLFSAESISLKTINILINEHFDCFKKLFKYLCQMNICIIRGKSTLKNYITVLRNNQEFEGIFTNFMKVYKTARLKLGKHFSRVLIQN